MAADGARHYGRPETTLLAELAATVHKPVVTNDIDATTSERVRGETRVRVPQMPGTDLARLSPAVLLRRQPSFYRVVLLLPINYVGTPFALPSPLTDAMLFGSMMATCQPRKNSLAGPSSVDVFYLCNASSAQWLQWLSFFAEHVVEELVVFCDCHGYGATDRRPAVLLGYPQAALSESQHVTNLRTKRVEVKVTDLISSSQIVDSLQAHQLARPKRKVVVVADCCHSAAVFGPAADAELPNTWFVLGSDTGEQAHVRRVVGVFSYFCMAVLKTEPGISFWTLRERLNTVLPTYNQHAVVRGPALKTSVFFSAPTVARPFAGPRGPPTDMQAGAFTGGDDRQTCGHQTAALAASHVTPPDEDRSGSVDCKLYVHKPARRATGPQVREEGTTTITVARLPQLYQARRHSLGHLELRRQGKLADGRGLSEKSDGEVGRGEAASRTTAACSDDPPRAAASQASNVSHCGVAQRLYPQRVRRRNAKVDVQTHHERTQSQRLSPPSARSPQQAHRA